MTKKNTIEMKRSDFVVLHNSLNEAVWRIAAATTEKRGLTADETMKIFKLIYPLAKGTQDIVFENDFTFCVAGVVKQ